MTFWRRVLGYALLLSTIPLITLFLSTMRYAWSRCPAGTFAASYLNVGIEFGLAMFLWFATLLVAGLLTISPKSKSKDAARVIDFFNRHSLAFAVGPLGALLLTTALMLDTAFSYYCATPSAILVHPGAFSHIERVSWMTVRTI